MVIRDAEAALAHQNSVTAQLDLQVITAILNAHLKTVAGGAALSNLQHDIETAVRTRTDLDTPGGARDFQRFLLGKLRDMRAVVASADLDDTSESALMAAWTSLYNASRTHQGIAPEAPAAQAAPASSPRSTGLPTVSDAGLAPEADVLPTDDPGWALPDPQPPLPSSPAPLAPAMPSIPGFGGGMMPGGATLPSSMPAWGMPGGVPVTGPLTTGDDRRLQDSGDTPGAEDPVDGVLPDGPDDNPPDGDAGAESRGAPEPPTPGPTTVTLPDGDTVTAASPQLAAAIKAATSGTPISDAFHRQGIAIPPPGTPVAEPIDPLKLTPGDIGIYTDRHALALGNNKVLLNGQIQDIATVGGPAFLGWEHPPPPTAVPATGADAPTPTRPASTSVVSV
ncbi:MAG: DUF4226 domain-containing protein [Mycobacterium sp.]|uniref:DUF4226 domain-containing protein n=1 Tax=Mycobacterium sp. TaxID=1785 RepID=UPI002604F4BC|nr:DUF4226 domain-containing protein [Mycobacterium sp.]MDI3313219.1 DUF4226 domain-containing protein [Mycobacterium sp.]